MAVAVTSFRSLRHNRFIAEGVELSDVDPVVLSHPGNFSGVAVDAPKPKRATKRAASKADD